MNAKSHALVEYASKKEVIKRGSEFILPINCNETASAVLHWHFSCGKNHDDFMYIYIVKYHALTPIHAVTSDPIR